jgi:hypothetical protein
MFLNEIRENEPRSDNPVHAHGGSEINRPGRSTRRAAKIGNVVAPGVFTVLPWERFETNLLGFMRQIEMGPWEERIHSARRPLWRCEQFRGSGKRNRAAVPLSPSGVRDDTLVCGREEQPSCAVHRTGLGGFGSLWFSNLCNSKNLRSGVGAVRVDFTES